MSRLQLVTWRPRYWSLGFIRFPAGKGLGLVYEWALHLGPIEVRRWRESAMWDDER